MLAILAARRHKWVGLRFLAAATIVSCVAQLTLVAFTEFGHFFPKWFLLVTLIASYAVFILTVVGWSILAFVRHEKDDHDA